MQYCFEDLREALIHLSNQVPLYTCLVSHFVQAGEVGLNNMKFEGIAGYCYPEKTSRSIPLYRYHKGHQYHLYTTEPEKEDLSGYEPEGVACFVLPK